MPYCENCGSYKDNVTDRCSKCGLIRCESAVNDETGSEKNDEEGLSPDTDNVAHAVSSSSKVEESGVAIKKSKSNLKDRLTLLVIVIFLCGVAALCILGILQVKYSEAQKCLVMGDYDTAYNKYISISSYRDSEDMALQCLYQKYIECIDSGNYPEAIDGFEQLGEYVDSPYYLKIATYGYAEQLFSESEYASARELFVSLGSFEDSQERTDECSYEIALHEYAKENWSAAKEIFFDLGKDYSDCGAYIALCDFHMAKETINNSNAEDIDNLREVFSSLEEYNTNYMCKNACADSLFTIMKLYEAEYSNGSISIKITANLEEDCLWMTYNNLWDMWGHKYWGYDEFEGKYGMFTYTKDDENWIDWFEIVGFDDPCAEHPELVVIKNPNNGKEYTLKRRK